MSTSTENVLTLQIPTSLTGSGNGGLGLNFDFGGNTTALANGAYSFLNTSFAQDQAFVGSSITGAQSFLSGILSPIVQASQQQIQQNTAQLPNLYSTLSNLGQSAINTNASLASTAMQVQQSIAQASIASSQADAQAASRAGGGGGGMCFITTAVCEHFGQADDCDLLMTLRGYRDRFMLSDPERAKLVQQYYETAPAIVEGIKKDKRAALIYRYILHAFLRPAYYAIKRADDVLALRLYSEMVEFAQVVSHG